MRTLALLLLASVLITLAVRLLPRSSDTLPADAAPPPAIDVGSVPPAFTLPDQDGRPVTVGGPASGWTLVSFFRRADGGDDESPW